MSARASDFSRSDSQLAMVFLIRSESAVIAADLVMIFAFQVCLVVFWVFAPP